MNFRRTKLPWTICLTLGLFGLLSLISLPQAAEAQALTDSFIFKSPPLTPKYDSKGNFVSTAKFALLYDYNTGSILYEKRGFDRMGPSSLTKLMTAYLTFEAVREGRVGWNTKFLISDKASRQSGTRLNVKKGTKVTVLDLIRGIIIFSGNDASVAMAEGLEGSEANFVRKMNEKAKLLGMKQSHFENTNGLPNDKHVMSAADLVRLAIHLYTDFPEYMKFFSQKEFTYNGVTKQSRNKLLFRGLGVDGFKTGFTVKNGYGYVVSAEQKGRRIFLVINGMRSVKDRMIEAERMVRHAFQDFKVINLYKKGQSIEPSPNTAKLPVPMMVAQDVNITIPIRNMGIKPKYEVKISYNLITAPVKRGDPVAHMQIVQNGKPLRRIPLVAAANVAQLNTIRGVIPQAKY